VNRTFNPQRVQRWAVSDLNPFLWPLQAMADFARGNRAPRDDAGRCAATERFAAAMVTAGFDLFRDLRDAGVENAFFRTYGPMRVFAPPPEIAAAVPVITAGRDLMKQALAHIEEGDRVRALVRIALLLVKAGTGRRRLSAMKRTRELVGKDVGLIDMPADTSRAIIREQSYIVDLEPEQALATLPKLLRTPEDRRMTLELLNRLEGRIEANEKQTALLAEIRRLVAQGSEIVLQPKRPARAGKQDVVRRARSLRTMRPRA
jgi:hypothetical protein